MKESNIRIGELMKEKLDRSQPSIRFSTVWDKHKKSSHTLFGLKRAIAIPVTALVSLMVLLTIGFTFAPIEDKTDYPFVDDPAVIGKWQSVDFISQTDEFSPDKRIYKDPFYIKELVFIKDGKMLTATNYGSGSLGPTTLTWTKGMVTSKQYKTASKYVFKEISGTTFMFFECKDGGYTYFHLKPKIYVLKKVDNLDYSNYKMVVREDKVDYPFVNDPQLVGKWDCVDYVKTPDEFRPGSTQERVELFLKQFNIAANGKISALTSQGKTPYEHLSWTKGLILDKKDKVAGKYEIKELKGDTYLFYEWKSGDYKFRGTKPLYYVLKKAK